MFTEYFVAVIKSIFPRSLPSKFWTLLPLNTFGVEESSRSLSDFPLSRAARRVKGLNVDPAWARS